MVHYLSFGPSNMDDIEFVQFSHLEKTVCEVVVVVAAAAVQVVVVVITDALVAAVMAGIEIDNH